MPESHPKGLCYQPVIATDDRDALVPHQLKRAITPHPANKFVTDGPGHSDKQLAVVWAQVAEEALRWWLFSIHIGDVWELHTGNATVRPS